MLFYFWTTKSLKPYKKVNIKAMWCRLVFQRGQGFGQLSMAWMCNLDVGQLSKQYVYIKVTLHKYIFLGIWKYGFCILLLLYKHFGQLSIACILNLDVSQLSKRYVYISIYFLAFENMIFACHYYIRNILLTIVIVFQ